VVLIEKIQKQAAPELVAAVKAGTISINAAAAVASLPVQEQAAAAAAGKDELKQAAKRVRESRRKTAAVVEAPENAAPSLADDDSVASLRQRVADLGVENASLRQQVLELQARLRQAAESAPFSA
jgi:preprotein translocase subunit SecD